LRHFGPWQLSFCCSSGLKYIEMIEILEQEAAAFESGDSLKRLWSALHQLSSPLTRLELTH
jgi:hypothetical protein